MKTKMKFKYAVLTAVTFLAAFTGCSNDDEKGGTANNTPKSLFLKISNDAPATYAEVPVQGAAPVVFSSGTLYFTDAAGDILDYYTISTAATSTSNINITTLTGSGETIQNLPGETKDVYVVGNTTGLPTSGNISVVKNKLLQVYSQATISNVHLYGTGTLPATPTTPAVPGVSNDLYSVSLTLAPTVARLELTDITATGEITGFEVAGIFVDSYYSQAAMDGTVDAGNMIINGTNAPAFDNETAEYNVALKGPIYDWYTPALVAVSNVVAPATGTVWGYNVFAAAGSAGGSTVPRIIIRLKNITATPASGITFPGDQFLTIRGLKSAGTALAAINAGEVYNIGAGVFTFDETNLTSVPNMALIDVIVNVTTANWVPVAVTPEL